MTQSPSEFVTWAKLTLVYIELNDFESALLSLNSCPMFSYAEKDGHKMPPPARTHLPLRTVTAADEIVAEDTDPKENQVHPELLRLPALALKVLLE